MASSVRTGSSFRDPSGFLFPRGGILHRQDNRSYRPAFDELVDSGLYREQIDAGERITDCRPGVRRYESRRGR